MIRSLVIGDQVITDWWSQVSLNAFDHKGQADLSTLRRRQASHLRALAQTVEPQPQGLKRVEQLQSPQGLKRPARPQPALPGQASRLRALAQAVEPQPQGPTRAAPPRPRKPGEALAVS